MYVELHLLQNFVPSCLNRDDTNAPKDCRFGGYRRARISSQCVKRAIRRAFGDNELLADEERAVRSARVATLIAKGLVEKERDEEMSNKVVAAALASQKITVKEEGKTEYLLFLGQGEITALTNVIHTHWDALVQSLDEDTKAASDSDQPKKSARKKKAADKEKVPAEVAKAVVAVLDGGKAADLALFGRMLADLPTKNVDAACQVAHAISTNKVDMEMDYFTAVDDLKTRDEDAGAEMLGVVEYNSACFYRYANIDLSQLSKNLQNDNELAKKTVKAFLKASINAIPTGKQNTFAAHNPPSLILAVVRAGGLWSLANAFARPVRPTRDEDLVQASMSALDKYWDRLAKVYGASDIRCAALCTVDEVSLSVLKEYEKANVDTVIQTVLDNLYVTGKGEEAA